MIWDAMHFDCNQYPFLLQWNQLYLIDAYHFDSRVQGHRVHGYSIRIILRQLDNQLSNSIAVCCKLAYWRVWGGGRGGGPGGGTRGGQWRWVGGVTGGGD